MLKHAFWGAVMALGAYVGYEKYISSGNGTAQSCVAKRDNVGYIEYYNKCSSPIHAIVCTDTPAGLTLGKIVGNESMKCERKIYNPNARLGMVAGDGLSTLEKIVAPGMIQYMACQASYVPYIDRQNQNKYICEKQ